MRRRNCKRRRRRNCRRMRRRRWCTRRRRRSTSRCRRRHRRMYCSVGVGVEHIGVGAENVI